MKKIKSLIIGNGEIGSSLKKVLDERKIKEKAITLDIKENEKDFNDKKREIDEVETIHICIPFSDGFENVVAHYALYFNPTLIIVHSTIPVGMTDILIKKFKKLKIRSYIVHSPVRGNHPDLSESMKKFIKYIGTKSEVAYNLAKKEMSNMKTKWFKKPEETELAKMLCTSYYGLCISWHREVERICKHFKCNFENVMTDFNITYNDGYKYFKPNVIRPVLTSPGKKKIGGHCVTSNAIMLNKQIESDFLKLIK